MPDIIHPEIYQRILAECIQRAGAGDLRVFGYGSLMWKPGFRVLDAAAARVYGYSRRLSVRSMHYRGTEQTPGLVFGLDAGGSCNGVLLRAAAEDKKRVLSRLFRREMFANVYEPRFVQSRILSSGKSVRALAFVVRRKSDRYAAPMPETRAARVICRARGFGGRNSDYVLNTREALEKRGVHCPQLARLCELLQRV